MCPFNSFIRTRQILHVTSHLFDSISQRLGHNSKPTPCAPPFWSPGAHYLKICLDSVGSTGSPAEGSPVRYNRHSGPLKESTTKRNPLSGTRRYGRANKVRSN